MSTKTVIVNPTDARARQALHAMWARLTARIRRTDSVTAIVLAATAVFALAGIGTPLLGLTVFADTGSLAGYSGYSELLAGTSTQHNYLRDQVDAALPNSILFGEALRAGEFAAWNPYALGGAPLGSTPNLAIASPISLPWWVLPGWLAPAYVKLLELIVAIGGTYLFLRRLRLGRAAATLGGLAFASSAFMVAWTGWPQTRVACLMPVLFWGLERLAQRVQVREIAIVALAVAGMLLGGFPAVTGYALVTAAGYLAVRVFAHHHVAHHHRAKRRTWRLAGRQAWRPALGTLTAAAAGVIAGVGLAAWQLVPWVGYMTSVFVAGRTQSPNDHIPADALLTAFAPYAFGTTNPGYPPDWFGSLELVDAQSYVGAAALILLLTAVAIPQAARGLLPRGVWSFVVGASAFWAIAVYAGGPLLAGLQRLSFLFSDNFVGRARSILGLLLAVLVAVGFEVLLRREPRTLTRPSQLYAITIWTGFVTGAVLAYLAGRRVVTAATVRASASATDRDGSDYLNYFHGQLGVGLAIMLSTVGCVAWLWWRGPAAQPRIHTAVAIVVPLLIAGQALAWVQTYYPRTDRGTFYPVNPTQRYLTEHLGHERYFGADGAIFGSVDSAARIRTYHGHGFIEQGYAELADTLPGEQFRSPTTAILSDPRYAAQVATQPVLDRAAVSHYVAPPWVRPFGPLTEQRGDGHTIDLFPGRSVFVKLAVTGPIRGVGITPIAAIPPVITATRLPGPVEPEVPDEPIRTEPPGSLPTFSPESSGHVRITLRDSTGRVITSGERHVTHTHLALHPSDDLADDYSGDVAWIVPLAAEEVPVGAALTAEITAIGTTALRVAGRAGQPALSVVSSAPDGLRLVYARESVIYERLHALPRARWAATARVEPDPVRRADLIATGALKPDEVLLNAPGPAADGRAAQVSWVNDGLNEMVISVRAQGAGHLVLADAIQIGWQATVDGSAATIVPADHGFVAVAVPAGTHTVRFSYSAPSNGLGVWITAATIAAFAVAFGVESTRRRRRAELTS